MQSRNGAFIAAFSSGHRVARRSHPFGSQGIWSRDPVYPSTTPAAWRNFSSRLPENVADGCHWSSPCHRCLRLISRFLLHIRTDSIIKCIGKTRQPNGPTKMPAPSSPLSISMRIDAVTHGNGVPTTQSISTPLTWMKETRTPRRSRWSSTPHHQDKSLAFINRPYLWEVGDKRRTMLSHD